MKLAVTFRRIEGTGAAIGWAGNKTVVADRRDGSAGGLGLGLSGGELQALALGAGYFNQLHFSADDMGLDIVDAQVDVSLEFSDQPLLVTSSEIAVHLKLASGAADEARLLAHAQEESTISNSVARGFPVSITRV